MLMILPKFDYCEPVTVTEACSLLTQYKGEAKPLGGGTDLLVKMKTGAMKPRYLVNLKRIPDLTYIKHSNANGLRVGTLTTIRDLTAAPQLKKGFGLLGEAVRTMGTTQTRSMATIGGNLCNASPAAATSTPLVALDAAAVITGPRGKRDVPLEQFFTGPGKTVLESNEILVEIRVPNTQPRTGWGYQKLSLRRKELAIVCVAALLTLDTGSRRCIRARIVLGSVAPTVIRSRRAEAVLEGKVIGNNSIQEASLEAMEESMPISDIRSTAEYRREMVKVLTGRAIRQALASV